MNTELVCHMAAQLMSGAKEVSPADAIYIARVLIAMEQETQQLHLIKISAQKQSWIDEIGKELANLMTPKTAEAPVADAPKAS